MMKRAMISTMVVAGVCVPASAQIATPDSPLYERAVFCAGAVFALAQMPDLDPTSTDELLGQVPRTAEQHHRDLAQVFRHWVDIGYAEGANRGLSQQQVRAEIEARASQIQPLIDAHENERLNEGLELCNTVVQN